MKRTKTLSLAVLLTVATVSVAAQSNPPAPEAAPPVSQVNNATYIIGGDDVLAIHVWKEPDLTTTLPVRADGMISLPLLNDVKAAGLTPMQLAADITDKLKKYLSDPRVTITVTQMNSQRIYAMGEVLHPGTINLLPNMTVLQALASCGFTQFANTKGIYVLRNDNGAQKKIPVPYKRLIKGEAMDQNIVLKPGDTIVVP
ncbi:MAG TPA: polysaccharide biosynthesis/export family protein [Terriglobales bacterium]|jgi:polysaccharide export outer membrane protein|nr:polysaccharide biosynthesis/export family protein [Terriglobales bacterium]